MLMHASRIRVDVCRTPCLYLQATTEVERLKSNLKQHIVDLVDYVMDLYSFEAPLPGFSLGPLALPSAGTLTGYVKHSSGGVNQIFALTCQHVVRDRKLDPSSYLHRDGQPKDLLLLLPSRIILLQQK